MKMTNLRFTEEELYKAIVVSAKNNRRSMNAEILRAIEYYLKNAPETQYQVKPMAKTPEDKET